MSVSWCYGLVKAELIKELEKHGLLTEGGAVELRQRLIRFIRKNPNLFMTKPADPENYDEEADISKDVEIDRNQAMQTILRPSRTSTPNHGNHTNLHYEGEVNTCKILDQIRKWNCHFEGKDVYNFLERAEELQRAYGFTEEDLLEGLPELLKGPALHWYRSYAVQLRTWHEVKIALRNYFLSATERRSLDRQIADRKQYNYESFREFCTALSTLMRRRGGLTEEDQLDNLYYNMKPELRLHMRRCEIHNVTDLVQWAEEHEVTYREVNNANRPPRTVAVMENDNRINKNYTYNRNECCWRCKQRGHTRQQCRNQPRLFCSVCGKDGVYTRNCHGFQSGNANRTAQSGSTTANRSEMRQTPATSQQ